MYVRMEERVVYCEKGRSRWVVLRREEGRGMVELNGRGKRGEDWIVCQAGGKSGGQVGRKGERSTKRKNTEVEVKEGLKIGDKVCM